MMSSDRDVDAILPMSRVISPEAKCIFGDEYEDSVSDNDDEERVPTGSVRQLRSLDITIYIIVLTLIVLAASFRFGASDPIPERYGIKEISTTGSWRDKQDKVWKPTWPADSLLDEEKHHWQPNGCKMRVFKKDDVLQCFANRKIIIAGDSTARVLFYGIMSKVNTSMTTTEGQKHNTRLFKYGTTEFQFLWDPFLTEYEVMKVLGAKNKEKPALLVFRSGIWYQDLRYAQTFQNYTDKMESIIEAAGTLNIADTVVLPRVEVTIPHFNRDLKFQAPKIITEMNQHLTKLEAEKSADNPLFMLTAFNQMIEGLDAEAPDGIHFSTKVAAIQADIVLNLACNDKLPQTRPFKQVCGATIPVAKWSQVWVLAALSMSSLAVLLFHASGMVTRFSGITHEVCIATTITLLFFFVIDRPLRFNKLSEVSDALDLKVTLGVLLGFGGIVTIAQAYRRTKESSLDYESSLDDKWMSRDQTNEWKGLMSLLAIFSWIDPSIAGFPPLLLSAFLFLTAYSNTTYFITAEDYSFKRFGKMVLRINTIPALFAYVMDMNYFAFYFAPLATLLFILIWTVMRIRSISNSSLIFVFGKLALITLISSLLLSLTSFLPSLVSFANFLFLTSWNSTTIYHLLADNYVSSLTGIVFALLMQSTTFSPSPLQPIAALFSFYTLLHSFSLLFFTSSATSTTQSTPLQLLHTSLILAYLILRNATPFLRSHSLPFITSQLGPYSLEIALVSFHIFSSGLEKGWINLVPFLPIQLATIISIVGILLVGRMVGMSSAVLLKENEKREKGRSQVEEKRGRSTWETRESSGSWWRDQYWGVIVIGVMVMLNWIYRL